MSTDSCTLYVFDRYLEDTWAQPGDSVQPLVPPLTMADQEDEKQKVPSAENSPKESAGERVVDCNFRHFVSSASFVLRRVLLPTFLVPSVLLVDV